MLLKMFLLEVVYVTLANRQLWPYKVVKSMLGASRITAAWRVRRLRVEGTFLYLG
jgi:hypothetical protein